MDWADRPQDYKGLYGLVVKHLVAFSYCKTWFQLFVLDRQMSFIFKTMIE